MKYIINNSNDPYFNLAMEEYVLKHCLADDVFLLWRNKPSLIIGKCQNTLEEINLDEVNKQGIAVVRRITGGGTVFHDLGNLNFSFICGWHKTDFHAFLKPIIDVLLLLGLPVEFNGRNDLLLEGKKISGNAQTVLGGRILHHGTLLFDTDISRLEKLLTASSGKFSSKGVKSAHSRVTNIKEHLAGLLMSTEDFQEYILCYLRRHFYAQQMDIGGKELAEVHKLSHEKYHSWDWTYGNSPAFTYRNTQHLRAGKVEVALIVNNGLIEHCQINGDFLSLLPPEELSKAMFKQPYHHAAVSAVLNNYDVRNYICNISSKELLNCFFAGTALLRWR